MPELPEVQTIVNELISSGLPGHSILSMDILNPGTLDASFASDGIARLTGKTIREISRTGKYILIRLNSPETLFVHLRMTGKFRLETASLRSVQPHDRIILHLNGGLDLVFNDTRKFGRWTLASEQNFPGDRLGADALDTSPDPDEFAGILNRSRRSIKALLLDQHILAGIGNIYADEILFETRLHPLTPGSQISRTAAAAILIATQRILKTAIAHRGSSLGSGLGNYRRPDGQAGNHTMSLAVYGRRDEPCRRCHTPIEQIRIAGRSTHFCPSCQKSN